MLSVKNKLLVILLQAVLVLSLTSGYSVLSEAKTKYKHVVVSKDKQTTKSKHKKKKKRAIVAKKTVAVPKPVLKDGDKDVQIEAASAPPASQSLDRMAAKKIFGAEKLPANLAPRSIGSYARGCLSGAAELPQVGEYWRVMRPSRNRYWGNPDLIKLVERLANETHQNDGWNGLLVGDLAQPRGGPMLSGHASHQIGLDADIWLTPMPDRQLSASDRENMTPTLVTKSRSQINSAVWTEAHAKLIRRAASYAQVARIFVHPPIKAELCKWATGDRSWLSKVRPYFGHNYHFHIRMKCPDGYAGCKNQAPAAPADGTGCGKELAYWTGRLPWETKKRDPNARPPKPAPPLTLAALPAECRAVVAAP